MVLWSTIVIWGEIILIYRCVDPGMRQIFSARVTPKLYDLSAYIGETYADYSLYPFTFVVTYLM
jgi:hypothetical protein